MLLVLGIFMYFDFEKETFDFEIRGLIENIDSYMTDIDVYCQLVYQIFLSSSTHN